MFTALWAFLSAWYNVPYTAFIGISLLLAVVQLMGLGGEPAEDAYLAVHADADVDAEADADADADLDPGADAHLDHDLDQELDQGDLGQSALGLLAFLG